VQPAPILDPQLLARLSTLQLRARRVVEGVLTGLHRSFLQGQAVEFAEHKEYAPGDDTRHLDWRTYARVDKYYVKKYELETNLRAFLVLDGSASMGYGSPVSKLDYGKTLAAALAFLMNRQQDMAGLVIAAGPEASDAAAGPASGQEPPPDAKLPSCVRRYLPPRASPAHLNHLLGVLEPLTARGQTDLAGAIDFVAEKAGRRAVVFVLSDLFDPSPRSLAGLANLRRRRCDVVLFHVLHRDELSFPFEDATEFLSLEGPERIEANPRSIRQGYLEELEAFLSRARRTLRDNDVEYVLAPTDMPPDKVLLSFLSSRERGGG